MRSQRWAPASGSYLVDRLLFWDAVGNARRSIDSTVGPSQVETITYGYDYNDRLSSATGTINQVASYAESATYDGRGNIGVRNGVAMTYDGNQPHLVTAFGGANYGYDQNGNMLTRTAPVSTSFAYDPANRLVKVTPLGVN